MPTTSNQFISPLALSTLDGVMGVAFNGIAVGDQSGRSVASAGDVNGDGFDDMLIGAPQASPGGLSAAGSTYLIFGSTGTWGSSLSLSSFNGINGTVINGAEGDGSGYSVASAGDVNGDGFDDVLIGAPSYDIAYGPTSGSTYLIFGYTGAWGSSLSCSSLNGTNGVVINGITVGDQSGYSVASAGDVNGDGIDDLVIGAPNASPGNLTQAGSTYLIFGHRGAWNSTLALSSLDGKNGVVINGIGTYDNSGTSVAGAGDVNGDGIDDLIIGAWHVSFGCISYAGSTYLIFGHNGTWSSPLALVSLNGTNGVAINGIEASDWSGQSVASAGDVNKDNISDVLIGAYGASRANFSETGSTYLIFGHRGVWSSPLSLSSLNGTNGVVINGIGEGGASGWSVASAGDVNGDGIDDMLIGAFSASPGDFIWAGSTYLIFGHTGAWGNPFALSSLNGTNGVIINGAVAAGYSGYSVTSGDMNGDGFNDILIGAYQAAVKGIGGGIPGVGSTYLIFGDNGSSLDLRINTLTINQGETVLLDNNMLLATIGSGHLWTNASIPFRISNVTGGTFSRRNFLQSELSQQRVSFTHDGSPNRPSYEVTVGNWAIVGPENATISFIPSSSETTTGAIAGGVVGALAGLGLLFGLQWYLKKKTNNQLQRILLEGTSDAEKAFNRDVVRPIANKIFDVINTTGCFGQRTEADTKAYMMAIGKIVSELRRQNANLDFNAMEPIDKESFLNEIANQTRQQSLPKHKGFSFGSCARYFKAEVTPQEIEYAAESIALASSVWQSKHMGGVSAKSRHLGLELGMLSSIVFPIEAANDGVPPEKQFTWMQNHVKVMEQQREQEQQELKQLKEQLAQKEAELASFKRQGAVALQA